MIRYLWSAIQKWRNRPRVLKLQVYNYSSHLQGIEPGTLIKLNLGGIRFDAMIVGGGFQIDEVTGERFGTIDFCERKQGPFISFVEREAKGGLVCDILTTSVV